MKRTVALLLALTLTTANTQALAWGDFEQGAVAGIAGVLLWNKLSQAAENNRARSQQQVQQHDVYRGGVPPQVYGQVPMYIPQRQMPIPTGFQEPCQFPGHHARIYDRYGMPVAVRVC